MIETIFVIRMKIRKLCTNPILQRYTIKYKQFKEILIYLICFIRFQPDCSENAMECATRTT